MPPSVLTLYVLLALTAEELDVPGICKQITEDTQNIVLTHERTLYKAVYRIEREGLIIRVQQGRAFALTPKGWAVFESEKHRLDRSNQVLSQRT